MVAAIDGRDLVVAAPAYRLRVAREACALALELRDAAGRWRRVCREGGRADFAVMAAGRAHTSAGAPARVRHAAQRDRVTVGIATVLAADRPVVTRIHLVCVEAGILVGYLQGRLHTHLRNPPTFLVHLPRGGSLQVHIQAVATQGARLECLLDGKLLKAINLPDRDGRNDGSAPEYDATYTFPVPPGKHRVTIQNTGGDWATVGWYCLKTDGGVKGNPRGGLDRPGSAE